MFESGKFDDMYNYCTKLLESNPDDMVALQNSALALLHLEKFEDSIIYCDKVLQIKIFDIYALKNKIYSLEKLDTPTLTGRYTYVERADVIFVDNGTGTSATNLDGFKAFEREAHKIVGDTFEDDPNAIVEFFDKGYVMQANPGITPYTGTIAGDADVMKFFTTPYGTKLEQYNINAQTIFAPLEVILG